MICEILSNKIKHVICEINGCKLQVSEDGVVFRFNKKNNPIIVNNTANSCKGYNYINCKGRMIFRHRIVAYCFLGLDINNPKISIDHNNGDKLGNYISNLRIVTHRQNHFNETKIEGYYYIKDVNKYNAQIQLNRKNVHLGCDNTEEEAHSAYLAGKRQYHKIN